MILDNLEEIITSIIKTKYEVDHINLVLTNRPDLCDYQINEVFKIAKENKLNPIVVGEDIVAAINNYSDFAKFFKNVEFVKPGFINISLSDNILNENLNYMVNNPKFGLINSDPKETFILDYGGPNIAKPLHVGHLRTAIIGEAIKRIIKYKGNDVIADVHLGDYGLQIGEVIYAILKDNKKDEEITLEYLNEAYPKMSAICKENEDIKKECEEITKKMQDGDLEYNRLCDIITEVSLSDIKDLYKSLDVSFDLWESERSAYKYIPIVEEILNNKGLLHESEGAMVIDVACDTDSKEIPPMIFQKSNKAYLYGTTDMATIYDREQKYQPDYMIYVTDDRQAMHFKQVFRASLKSGITDTTFEHKSFGTVNGPDGKPFKTRAGKSPSLRELLNETKDIFISKKEDNVNMSDVDINKIVNSIVKFADLQNNMANDYIFDINKFSNTSGKTGPYILYTYLRINKIIKDKDIDTNILTNEIYNNYERDLKLKLLEYQNVIDSAFVNRMPNYIADYLYDLCVLINTFYQNNHINSLDDKVKQNNWIYLLSLTNELLKELLNLLAIEIPTEM